MKVYVEIEVPENWAQRLDMQPHIEREIAADRWAWRPIPDLPTLRTLMRNAINAAEARMSPLADFKAMTLQAIDAENLLWQGIQAAASSSTAASGVAPAPESKGYMEAFYQMAALLGIEGAQAKSPEQVYAEQVKPALEKLIADRSHLQDAYLNMRAWAEQNGLDTTAYGVQGTSKEQPCSD